MLLDQIAIAHIDIDERRLHVGNVEFPGAAVGMSADAAIGDHHGAAVREARDVVRLHPVRIELGDLPVAAGRIANTDDTAGTVVVIFCRVEDSAVGGEDTMPREMPVGSRLKPGGFASMERNRNAELTGMARE